MRAEIIVPDHPRWPEFIAKLSRARLCYGTTEQTRITLAAMGDVDVEGTLSALKRLGGNCDCQIELDIAGTSANIGA